MGAAPPAYPPQPLGIVTFAEHARVGETTASAGTTLYEDDRLFTDEIGSLRVSDPGFQLELQPRTTVALRRFAAPNPMSGVEISAGTIEIATKPDVPFAILAAGAVFHPDIHQPLLAVFDVCGPREVHVSVQRGSLTISYRLQDAVLTAGESYGIVLSPTDRERALAASLDSPESQGGNRKTARSGSVFLVVLLSAAGVSAFLAHGHGHKHMESPDSPDHGTH